jgi:hypothetical protein
MEIALLSGALSQVRGSVMLESVCKLCVKAAASCYFHQTTQPASFIMCLLGDASSI